MIYAVYFSPAGTTERVVKKVGTVLTDLAGGDLAFTDYTQPAVRKAGLVFKETDWVIFGMPTYAGRIPNLIRKEMENLQGGGARCIPLVLFGNRAFDDALLELTDLLEERGFRPMAAGAFVGQHAFSGTLGAGRPNGEDLALAEELARLAFCRKDEKVLLQISGTPKPYSGYYQPRWADGTPIDIRKVKPGTKETCDGCGLCARICPMGAISAADPKEIPGVCIKCGACLKRCPRQAKYIDDPGYLAHKKDLEENQARPKTSVIF